MTILRSVLAMVTAAAAAAAAPGCSETHGHEPKPARPVKAQAVAPAPVQAGVRYSATIEPFQQVPLAFKSSGYVEDLALRRGADGRSRPAQAGDRVDRGAVLARVHEADYRQRVDQGRATLAEGEATRTKAALDLERARALFAAESLTKPDLDAAQAAFDGAEARVAAARAEIEIATSALRDCALVTPAAGVLLERRIEVGTLVGAGTVGFLLGDVSSVKAKFGIPDAMIQSVALGEPIGVTIEAIAGSTFSGRVTSLAPAADPQSRVFDVEVTIPNRDGRLRPGMIGTVALDKIASGAQPAAPPLVIPLSAVVKSAADGGKYAVLVIDRKGDTDVARLREIRLGDVLGNGVAVLEGLRPGERVIVTGASLLVDGDPVRIIP
jgi:RND family efflux transporter MFP subunit